MHQVVPLRSSVRVVLLLVRAALPLVRAARPSDPLKVRAPDPALVRANADVDPFANRLTDRHFGAFVKSEKIGAGAIR